MCACVDWWTCRSSRSDGLQAVPPVTGGGLLAAGQLSSDTLVID